MQSAEALEPGYYAGYLQRRVRFGGRELEMAPAATAAMRHARQEV